MKILDDLFGLFGSGEIIGLDIGQTAIKAAILSKNNKGQYRLSKFSSFPLPEGSLIDDQILRPEEIQRSIVECMKKGKMGTKNVCIGLSGSGVVTKKLQLVEGNSTEIEDQMSWEMEQYLPFGIDEAVISHSVLGKNEASQIEVMVAAAKIDVANLFKDVVSKSGLKVKIIDLHLFALANLFELCVAPLIPNIKGGVLVLDFGAQKTNMNIFFQNILIFAREMSIGGMSITDEIQKQMGLTFNEAENLKVHGDDSGNLPEEILSSINRGLDALFTEIKKTLNFFMNSSGNVSLEVCYVTGGAAITPGLMEGLESTLGLEVRPLNPFDAIAYEESQFEEGVLDYCASCGAVALGLAMRKI